MSPSKRQLSLNLFVHPGGHHEAGWRYSGSEPKRAFDITYYQELAQRAEAAKFDALFFADQPALVENIRYASRFRFEPFTWMAALAPVTSHIGLIGTASTTYFEPYNVARLFNSLDHLSNGRAAINIVTTAGAQASANFGLDAHADPKQRYARAGEFLDVLTKLWDSWEDDALVADAASGIFADDTKVHAIDHVGEFFRVKGPLNLARSPQGRPVYVQAGASDDGRAFAAQYAEAIFTAHQTLASAQEFYADVKQRAARLGREPAHVKILPGIIPFIGSTEAEAKALHEEFNELIQPAFTLGWIKQTMGIDLTGHDLDAPFPRELIDMSSPRAVASRYRLVVDIIDREKPTLRELIRKVAGGRGHSVVTGTPEQLAQNIETWFQEGAADGFNVMPPWLTGGFDVFVAEVLPILRRRGLFREEYSGTTLRDHYGLPRPASVYSQTTRAD